MEYTKSEWNGFLRLDFEFEGQSAILVLPKTACEGNKWLFKTEYFGAFPQFEIEMLARGYALAHVSNITRWCLPQDTDRKAHFADFLQKEFGLHKQCLPVGMSCGGMQAVYFADKYPQYVAALYLDAPVMNLLSCPCGLGAGPTGMYEEFTNATGMTQTQLLNYRHHPIDCAQSIIERRIPTILICGDGDTVVPYAENGAVLAEKMEASDCPFRKIIKEGCNHHPHGLEDNTPLIEFTETYYQ